MCVEDFGVEGINLLRDKVPILLIEDVVQAIRARGFQCFERIEGIGDLTKS